MKSFKRVQNLEYPMKKYLALVILSLSFNASALTCYGTEPFFGLAIDSTSMSFGFYGAEGLSEKIISTTDARGTKGFAYKVRTKNMSASIITGDCNDGMSDRNYPFHLLLERGNDVFYGCCLK